jgi:aminoglycoside/choline kinase family phosphotransferase
MATDMSAPPGAPAFLSRLGWTGASVSPLAGDASFRRYFRVTGEHGRAVLMDAPPDKEDCRPFVSIAAHLDALGYSAPRALGVDFEEGLLLLEDFGDAKVTPLLEREPEREADIYRDAVDLLVDLHTHAPPAGLRPYDRAEMRREVLLFTEWYLPDRGLAGDVAAFADAWDGSWGEVLDEVARAPVLVLRDYHADNLMLLAERDGIRRIGLLDFQDALAGHRAYDLVSLLQDARRDVRPELEAAMLDRYLERAGIEDRAAFESAYHLLGVQRNTKILGIFLRLWRRDGKAAYTALCPRVWGYLERSLGHPRLEPVRRWFDMTVPQSARAAAFGRPA